MSYYVTAHLFIPIMRYIYVFFHTLLLCLLSGLTACTSYLKDPDETGTPLEPEVQMCELSSKQTYIDVKILNGSGSYLVASADFRIAQATVEEGIIRIFGFDPGETHIKVADDASTDLTPAKIKVVVTDSIKRPVHVAKPLIMRFNDSRMLKPEYPEKGCTWEITNKNVAVLGFSSQGTTLYSIRTGDTKVTLLKDHWPIQTYVVQVTDENYLGLSNPVSKIKTDRPDHDFYVMTIHTGNNRYTAASSDESVATASILPYSGKYNDSMCNPAEVWIKARKSGSVMITATDVVTGRKADLKVDIEVNSK